MENSDPRSAAEALSNQESKRWKDAMKNEFDALKNNEVWDLLTLSDGKKSMWILKSKTNGNGEVLKYKARLVAKGCSQSFGTDFTTGILFSLALQLHMNIDCLDLSTAFLNGKLDEEVYMEQPVYGFHYWQKQSLSTKTKTQYTA